MADRTVLFSADELARIERARVLVSAGDFHLPTSEFVRICVLHAVDEVLGTNDAAWRERAAQATTGASQGTRA